MFSLNSLNSVTKKLKIKNGDCGIGTHEMIQRQRLRLGVPSSGHLVQPGQDCTSEHYWLSCFSVSFVLSCFYKDNISIVNLSYANIFPLADAAICLIWMSKYVQPAWIVLFLSIIGRIGPKYMVILILQRTEILLIPIMDMKQLTRSLI